MEEIIKTIAEYGIAGGSMVILCYMLVYQMKVFSKHLGALTEFKESMMAHTESIVAHTKKVKDLSEDMSNLKEANKKVINNLNEKNRR